jgi:hypothetical protein
MIRLFSPPTQISAFIGGMAVKQSPACSRIEGRWDNDVSHLNNAVAQRDCEGVKPVPSPELADGGLNVNIDRARGDMQNLADLAAGLALRHQRKHFKFARRER